jgi:hypothetical protein
MAEPLESSRATRVVHRISSRLDGPLCKGRANRWMTEAIGVDEARFGGPGPARAQHIGRRPCADAGGNGSNTGSNPVGSAVGCMPDCRRFKRDNTSPAKPFRSSPSSSASAHAIVQARPTVLEGVAYNARGCGSRDQDSNLQRSPGRFYKVRDIPFQDRAPAHPGPHGTPRALFLGGE